MSAGVSNYPSGFDDFIDMPVEGQPGRLEFLARLGNAVEKIQQELGLEPSGAATSVGARLDAMTSTGKEALVIFFGSGSPPTRVSALGAVVGADLTRTVLWFGTTYAPTGGDYAGPNDAVFKIVTE